MKMRTWAGAVATALLLAGCGGSAVEPDVAGPRMDYIEIPDDGNGNPIETDSLKGGYFGSGHTDPKPDTISAPG
jgi:hypothetical protein